MATLIWTERAFADLEEIGQFISKEIRLREHGSHFDPQRGTTRLPVVALQMPLSFAIKSRSSSEAFS